MWKKMGSTHRVPREVWLRCGGYDGWSLDVGHSEQVVPEGDEEALDRGLGKLDMEGHDHICITRYEEDSLTVFTNPDCAWLMYLREPGDSGLYLSDPSKGEGLTEFNCECGTSLEMPLTQTVSHTQALDIVREYFKAGKLPEESNWEEG